MHFLWSDLTFTAFFIKIKKIFLVKKGTYKGKPISVHGIKKRMEYYAHKSGVRASCQHLQHTMATQMLNTDADMVTIQDLLGHAIIATTERYSKVSNIKVQRDYHKAVNALTEKDFNEEKISGYKKLFTKEKRQMLSKNILDG